MDDMIKGHVTDAGKGCCLIILSALAVVCGLIFIAVYAYLMAIATGLKGLHSGMMQMSRSFKD